MTTTNTAPAYYVNYHTGAGDYTATTDDLDALLDNVDSGLAYTQQPVTVHADDIDGDVVARRPWWGCLDGIDECESPVQFGTLGYYGDWERC